MLIAAPADASPAQAFHGVTAVRVLDTREGTGTRLGSGATLDLVIPGLSDDATSVSVNLTVVDGSEGSFLTVYPTGEARPTTSSINWNSSAAVANSATIRVGASHSVSIFNLKGTVNVVMDLLGYYAPAPEGGPPGATGATGPSGATGQHGADGVDGQQGPQGVASPPAQPLYFYASNAVAETVPNGAAISFADAGPSSPSGPDGVVLDVSRSALSVPVGGVFEVSFSALGDEDNQFSIQINNLTPPSGALVFGAVGKRANVQTVLIALSAGDSVSIVNISSGAGTGTVHLDPTIGGTSMSINAWISIQQVS
jgi:hypothetical protein